MSQLRSNKGQAPVNSDTWNLTGDLATLIDSLEVIVPVANRTEGDSVATARAAAGWAITDARPLFVWNTTTKMIEIKDSSGWRNNAQALGLLYQNQVGSVASAIGAGPSVVNSIPSFTFKGGRNYRIVWDTSYYQSQANDLFFWSIATCAVGDSSTATTGLTTLDGRTKGIGTPIAATTQHTGAIMAYYKPGTDTTVQLKFVIQRAVGSGTVTVVGQSNEEATYLIYDDGAQI